MRRKPLAPAGNTFVDRMHWDPSRPSQLLVFDREDLALLSTMEVPATFVFHFGNGWEDGDTVNFTACRYRDSSLMTRGMRHLARRDPGPLHPAPELVRYRLSLSNRRVDVESLDTALEFPGSDRRQPFTAQPVFGTDGHNTSESALGSAVQSVDPVSGEVDGFDYGNGIIAEEPIHVPGHDGGYLVHSYLDYRQNRSGIAILKARRLADGPLALASMKRILPLGFHGCFLPQQA